MTEVINNNDIDLKEKKDLNLKNDKELFNYSGYRSYFYGTLSHLSPLFLTGSTRALEQADVGALPDTDTTHESYRRYQELWDEELLLDIKDRSFWRPYFLFIGKFWPIFATCLQGFTAAFTFASPMILKALTLHVSGVKILQTSTLWFLCSLLFICPILGSMFNAQAGIIFTQLGVQSRNALVSIIFRKALVLSPAAKMSSSGTITNIFSSDTEQFERTLNQIGPSIFAPIQIIVALALIHAEVGNTMFVAFGIIFVLLPILGYISSFFMYYIKQKIAISDQRIKLTQEMLNGYLSIYLTNYLSIYPTN
jgi:ABC-type multidrug transport system fused ATPase/permease subunit